MIKNFVPALLAALLILPAASLQADTPTGKKPNIIFILAYDLGWGDLGCYGYLDIAPRVSTA